MSGVCRLGWVPMSTGIAGWTRSWRVRLMGIQAIKGVEVGDGFELARAAEAALPTMRSCRVIRDCPGVAPLRGHRGGGMSTGEVLRVRAAMKPISTVPRALRTVDVADGRGRRRPSSALGRLRRTGGGRGRRGDGRLVLANAALEKFGGDSVAETRRNYESYLKQLADRDFRCGISHEHPPATNAELTTARSYWSVHPAPARALSEPCSRPGSAFPFAMSTRSLSSGPESRLPRSSPMTGGGIPRT